MSSSSADRIGFVLWAGFSILQFVVTFSLATIAGYMIIGGFGGMIAMLAGFKGVLPYMPGIGWSLGGLLGLGNVVAKIRRDRKAAGEASSSGTRSDSDSKNRSDKIRRMTFRWPTIGQLFKSIGLGGLFGAIGGIIVSVFLCVVLISVTTSPFVPMSWRPQTKAPSSEELERDRRAGRSRDGVSTNFEHPLIWPIVFWSGCSMCSLGLLGGAAMGFFEDPK